MVVIPCRRCGQWQVYLVGGVVSVGVDGVWSVSVFSGSLPCRRCGQCWG